jgi:hypothetical protein
MAAALLAPVPAQAQFFQFFNPQPARPPVAAPPHREVRPKPKKPRPKPEQRRSVAKAEPQKPDAPKVEGPPPPFEPQLLRLSEIMGALAVLDPLCGDSGATLVFGAGQLDIVFRIVRGHHEQSLAVKVGGGERGLNKRLTFFRAPGVGHTRGENSVRPWSAYLSR